MPPVAIRDPLPGGNAIAVRELWLAGSLCRVIQTPFLSEISTSDDMVMLKSAYSSTSVGIPDNSKTPSILCLSGAKRSKTYAVKSADAVAAVSASAESRA